MEMKQLSKLQTIIFLAGAVLMVVGAGLNMAGNLNDSPSAFAAGAVVFAVGAVAFASMQCEEPRRVAIMRTLRRAAIGTAAALAITLCLTLYANFREDRALARLYGGSYVIENGRRIDDLSSIREDIEQTLDDARRIESRTHHDFIDNAEQEVLDNITDPEMQKEVEQMLNE